MTDLIEKALKRGKEDEQRAAAILAALVCVQLGLSESAESFYQELRPTLVTQLTVPTAPQRARAAMATTLGLLAFLQCPPEETEEVMTTLESVFRSAGASAELQAEALSAWALLATFLPSYKSVEALRGSVSNYLLSALDSSDVDLRIASGEAVAVLYERADDEMALKDEFYEKIKDLSTDSNKYRSKKDRKEQRSSFREVLKTIEGEESPIYIAKMIRTNEMMEKLIIDSWRSKKQYDLMRKVSTIKSKGLKCTIDLVQLFFPTSCVGSLHGRVSPAQRDRPRCVRAGSPSHGAGGQRQQTDETGKGEGERKEKNSETLY